MAYELTPARNRKYILLLWLFLYASFTLIAPPLLDGTDAVHAEAAREMVQRGNGMVLSANGMRLWGAAPLLFASMAASMKLLGVGAVQARLPLALYALALFLLTESFARRAFRSVRAGIYAAMVLLLCPGFFAFTRILVPQAIGCLWLTAALYCLWIAEQQEQRPGYLPAMGFGAACALNVLSIGWPGLLLPVGIAAAYLLLTRGLPEGLRRVTRIHPWMALFVFLLLALPWHVAGARAGAEGWRLAVPRFAHLHNPWMRPEHADALWLPLFWCLLPVWMVPWSAFLFPAMRSAVPWQALRLRPAAHALDREQKAHLLLALAALLPLVLYSFQPWHVYDVLPSLPFLAMLAGRWLDREAGEVENNVIPPELGQAGQRIATALLVAASLAAMACLLLLVRAKEPSPHFELAETMHLERSGHALFPYALHWDPAAIGAFHDSLTLAAAALFGGTMAAWWLRRNFRPHHANIVLAIASVMLLVAGHKALQTVAPLLSSERLAQTIQPQLRPDDLIVINGTYASAATFGFYLHRDNLHLWHAATATDAPNLLETDETMRMRWNGVQRVFVWTETGRLPALPGRVYVIAEGGGKQIVSNRETVY